MTSILHMALYIYNSHNIPLRKKGIIIIVYTAIFKGLPWWLSGKEFCCNAGDASLIPGPGRSPGEGNGNPLQYSCLGNSMIRGALQATVYGGHKRVGHDLTTNQQQVQLNCS